MCIELKIIVPLFFTFCILNKDKKEESIVMIRLIAEASLFLCIDSFISPIAKINN